MVTNYRRKKDRRISKKKDQYLQSEKRSRSKTNSCSIFSILLFSLLLSFPSIKSSKEIRENLPIAQSPQLIKVEGAVKWGNIYYVNGEKQWSRNLENGSRQARIELKVLSWAGLKRFANGKNMLHERYVDKDKTIHVRTVENQTPQEDCLSSVEKLNNCWRKIVEEYTFLPGSEGKRVTLTYESVGKYGVKKGTSFSLEWIKDPDYPDEISECCTYPDEKQTCYSHNVQGVTHDQSNWFISNPTQLWAFPFYADLNNYKPEPFIFAHINGWPQFRGYRFKDLSYYEMESEPPTSRRKRLVFIALCHDDSRKHKAIISVHRAPQFGANKNNYDPLGHVVTKHEELAWVAVNPIDGLLYTSGTIKGQENKFIYVYSFSFTGGFHIDFVRNIYVRDELGNPLFIDWVQGGCFSNEGHLYISSGSYEGYIDNYGINGIDLRTGRRFLHFRPDYEPGWSKYQEIEGITYWDLGTKNSHIPNMGGQIHLLVLDNDCLRDNGTGSGSGCGNPDDVIFRHIWVNINRGQATFCCTVSAGSSDDLDRYRRLYRYSLPPGKRPNDIVGMALDGSNNYTFVWFKSASNCEEIRDEVSKAYKIKGKK